MSPDGSTLYVAGSFTQVNGQSRYRVAAFDVATGHAHVVPPGRQRAGERGGGVAARPSTSRARSPTSTATRAEGRGRQTRRQAPRCPSRRPWRTARLRRWSSAPDEGSVVIGGSFTSVDGSVHPRLRPRPAGRDHRRDDGAAGERLRPRRRHGRRDPEPVDRRHELLRHRLRLRHRRQRRGLVRRRLGDRERWSGSRTATATPTRSYPAGDAVYSASHKHYCGNSGGFPQTIAVDLPPRDRDHQDRRGRQHGGPLRLPGPRRAAVARLPVLVPGHQHRHVHRPVPGPVDGDRQRQVRPVRRRVHQGQRRRPSRAWCASRCRRSRRTRWAR